MFTVRELFGLWFSSSTYEPSLSALGFARLSLDRHLS